MTGAFPCVRNIKQPTNRKSVPPAATRNGDGLDLYPVAVTVWFRFLRLRASTLSSLIFFSRANDILIDPARIVPPLLQLYELAVEADRCPNATALATYAHFLFKTEGAVAESSDVEDWDLAAVENFLTASCEAPHRD